MFRDKTLNLVYRYPVKADGDGIIVESPQVVVLGWQQDGTVYGEVERRTLAGGLAAVTPAFRVRGDGSWERLVDPPSGGMISVDTLEAASIDRWRLVSEGWQDVRGIGQVHIERAKTWMPPLGELPMTIQRTVISHGPCVQQPRQRCRVRLLRTTSELEGLGRGGELRGEGVLEARVEDAPGSPWPAQVVSERWFEIRAPDGQVVTRKESSRRERWGWE